jgi:hypothetical protein
VREQVAFKLWQVGVYDQAGYAEAVTGSPEVVVEMDEPPNLLPPVADPAASEEDTPADEGANSLLKALAFEKSLPPLREMLPEYEGKFAACNGHR